MEADNTELGTVAKGVANEDVGYGADDAHIPVQREALVTHHGGGPLDDDVTFDGPMGGGGVMGAVLAERLEGEARVANKGAKVEAVFRCAACNAYHLYLPGSGGGGRDDVRGVYVPFHSP